MRISTAHHIPQHLKSNRVSQNITLRSRGFEEKKREVAVVQKLSEILQQSPQGYLLPILLQDEIYQIIQSLCENSHTELSFSITEKKKGSITDYLGGKNNETDALFLYIGPLFGKTENIFSDNSTDMMAVFMILPDRSKHSSNN